MIDFMGEKEIKHANPVLLDAKFVEDIEDFVNRVILPIIY